MISGQHLVRRRELPGHVYEGLAVKVREGGDGGVPYHLKDLKIVGGAHFLQVLGLVYFTYILADTYRQAVVHPLVFKI